MHAGQDVAIDIDAFHDDDNDLLMDIEDNLQPNFQSILDPQILDLRNTFIDKISLIR